MNNKVALYRLVLRSLPLIVIGGILLRLALRQQGCFGMADGLAKLFLWFVGSVYFIVILFICLNKYTKDRYVYDLIPVFIPVGMWLLYGLLTVLSSRANPKPLLVAYLDMQNRDDQTTLTLNDNQMYQVELQHVEASCMYQGHFQLKNDTLQLDKEVTSQTAQALYHIYLVNNTYFIPLINGKASTDTTLYLTIQTAKH